MSGYAFYVEEGAGVARRAYGPRIAGVLLALACGGGAPALQGAYADTPAPSQDLMKAAVVVLTYDALAAECRRAGAPSADVAARTGEWERTNRVDRVRVRLPELMVDPARRAQLERASRSIVDVVHSKGADPCLASGALVRTPEAQFGALVPELAAENAAPDRGATGRDGANAPVPSNRTAGGGAGSRTASSPATPAAPSRIADTTLAQIEGFAFDTRPAMGFGGFITIEVYPVVVFRDGWLLTDVTALGHPGGLQASRRDRADDWTHWRRVGGELQRQGEKGWEKLEFQKVYARLPANFRLEGTFRRLGGGGNLAVGGTDAVAVWSEYTFTSDGRVQRGGGAGARSEAGDVSTVTRGAAPSRSGRYRVDGLRLRIDYDDGTSEAPVLVADPSDPKGAIWLDGEGYVQRRK